MDLFDKNQNKELNSPLAAKMRPTNFSDFVGQEHIVAEGSLLRKLIESDNISSFIFWGPPGCGKSTLAGIIAENTSSIFVSFSAVTSGIPDLRKIIEKAKEDRKYYNKKTILFIDEIHRFNKAQQDALLPHVEDGTVILIGATTENPYFEVNTPLLSRSRIIQFSALSEKSIEKIIKNTLENTKSGFADRDIDITNEALEHIVNISTGDARSALNILEMCVKMSENGKIDLNTAELAAGEKILGYDKNGDAHYDTISAFIKSMRGSDPDAALYYLAVMLSAGEDIKFIARRIVIAASEDVGNADPMALVIANNAAQAIMFIGMPEAQIILAQAVTYIASAPKSNASYLGINKAIEDVKNEKVPKVPIHLRDASYKGAQKLEHGKGYLYPHDYENGWVEQNYLPDEISDRVYYEPNARGHEGKFKQKIDTIREFRKNKLKE